MAVFTAGAVLGAVEELRARLFNKAVKVLGNNVTYEKGYFRSSMVGGLVFLSLVMRRSPSHIQLRRG